jgi:hypothetical protein
MKDKNKITWEHVEAQWRGQMAQLEEPAPAFNWDQLDATNSRPIIPLWRRVAQSPWAWTAVLGLSIGLNWQNIETAQTVLPTVAVTQKQMEEPSEQLVSKQDAPKVRVQMIKPIGIATQPADISPVAEEEITVAKVVDLSQAVETKNEEEVILVRIDIDPIEERKTMQVAETVEKPVKRKRNLLGQIFRQVISGEPGGWREIANSNDKLSDGIHLVANTVIRTEQSVKQTLQFQ